MSLPEAVDLRPAFQARGLEPRAQGERGTCSIFALIGLLEFEHGGLPRGERLSVEFLNWASHQTNGRQTDGSFFADALEGLKQYGVCRETLLPYAPTFAPDLAPPETAREDARTRRKVTAEWFKEWDVTTGLNAEQMTAIRRCLAAGRPVAVGLRWPKQPVYQPGHLLTTPPPEDVFDGHSIVLVGYQDDPRQSGGGTFLFRNSSGPDWQEQGHARFSYEYASRYANDAVGLTVGG